MTNGDRFAIMIITNDKGDLKMNYKTKNQRDKAWNKAILKAEKEAVEKRAKLAKLEKYKQVGAYK